MSGPAPKRWRSSTRIRRPRRACALTWWSSAGIRRSSPASRWIDCWLFPAGVLDQYGHRVVAALARVLQRRQAVAVGDVGVRPRGQQHPHDLEVARTTVAEDHGLQQGGPAQVIDVIDIDLGAVEQQAHRIDMPAFAGWDQRIAAVAVALG